MAAKFQTDPLYPAISGELQSSRLPLLDIGCGLGLLALYLRADGHDMRIHGIDYDARKIECARGAIAHAGHTGVRFEAADVRHHLADHHGNVTMLDMLQFFTSAEQQDLLRAAAERVQGGGKLLIRSGLRDASWRHRVTVFGDVVAKLCQWMKAGPTHYPSAGEIDLALSPFGKVTIRPLWDGTPFNNHLIVLERTA